MEILIAVAVLILVGVAAWFWGVDSRPPLDDPTLYGRPRRAI
jgi:nitrogen fixation-related uncharacterized protein